ncbi:MAG: hypothetical protein M1515_05360 [Candidatus Thermoplasmatota archaeon]|jgi:hypothetical protein|nr:hypothetical protein [Candidatus Thermoplasmatota archaeon]
MKYTTILIVLIILLAGLIYLEYVNNFGEKKQSASSHIYIGTIYTGTAIKTQSISANLNFIGGRNNNKTPYYVVISAWDDNKSYDQVGISSIEGIFFATYSYTRIINGTIRYFYNPHWFEIYPGLHSFGESISSGFVTFKFDNRIQTNYTGGNYFTLSPNEHIGNTEYNGFTVYEEIYSFAGTFPQISYNFSHIAYGPSNLPITKWQSFTYNVSANFTKLVVFNGSTVNIYNQNPAVLKIRIIGGTGHGYLNVSDFSLPVQNNKTYSLSLIGGEYNLSLYFLLSSKTFNGNYVREVTGTTWVNITVTT